MKKLFVLLFFILLITGCGSTDNDGLISYMEAMEKIINENAVVMDVRSEAEYMENHINGAVLIPLDTISDDSVATAVKSKDTPIIVYCRSGNRSSQAVIKLLDLGYTEVYDLGSIDNWED